MEYNIAHGEVEAFSTLRDAELPYYVVTGHQVHGTKIAKVTDPMTDREDLEGYDALITDVPGCAIGVRTADCIPAGKETCGRSPLRLEGVARPNCTNVSISTCDCQIPIKFAQ